MVYPPWDGRSHESVERSPIDCPYADTWVEAANFKIPASPRNIHFVAIHITGGPAMDEGPPINTFLAGPASAHYIVNREGRITQMVRDAHIANHIDNIHSVSNAGSIGIEHVNPWNVARRLRPTTPQYVASARLVAWLCRRYGIPPVHAPQRGAPGIRGHMEEQPNTGHTTCPNPAWEWPQYIGRVRSALAQGPTFEDTISRLTR